MDVDQVWADYVGTGSETARNALISNYMPLVRLVAGRVGTTLPASVDREDLTSYGVFGLIDAIQRFDLDRGVKFETYAVTRIRGAIIDELRALDWVPRSVRSRHRDIERSLGKLESRLGRTPTEEELAKDLSLSVAELHSTRTASLSAIILLGAAEDHDYEHEIPDLGASPEDQFINGAEVVTAVAHAVASLPERSRVIASLYYLQDMTLAEIGGVLGVTESRVCQLQSRLLHELREALGSGLAA